MQGPGPTDPELDSDGPAFRALERFAIQGETRSIERFRRGHIQRSYIATSTGGRYLLQQLNETVFPDVVALAHNVSVVTGHLAEKGLADTAARPLPTRDGEALFIEDDPARERTVWRCLHFVENTESHDLCDGPERAHSAARAFGAFQSALADLEPSRLQETLPRFFDPLWRFEELRRAASQAAPRRRSTAAEALAFAESGERLLQAFGEAVAQGAAPDRVLHGDTKLNNVLFRKGSTEAVCVVDLDTCMPGWSGYDVGDLVRFTAASAREDERDLDLVETDLELYRALVDGYLGGAEFCSDPEIAAIPLSAQVVTFTIGLRFLADHLRGDRYFQTDRPGQNLDRARVQFRLVESMRERREAFCAALPASQRAPALAWVDW